MRRYLVGVRSVSDTVFRYFPIVLIIYVCALGDIARTGMGRVIEHYHRTVPFDALLGGGQSPSLLPYGICSVFHTDKPAILTAEDVLGDLGVRQAMRNIPKSTRL